MLKKIILLVAVSCAMLIAQPDFEEIFKYYPKGCISVYDVNKGEYIKFREDLCKIAHLPASTFKIPNTMIGLETGVLKDADHFFRWDSTKQRIDSWNRDHTLRSAFRNSVVWYYIRVAKEIGDSAMQNYLNQFDYGNKNISGAKRGFWLDGNLRISVDEQIEFLKKVYFEQFPLSEKTYDILKDIMVFEENVNYSLSAKTGWADQEENIGWIVGWLEENDNTYIFALNIRSEDAANFAQDRIELFRKVFTSMGLLKQ
jgi:beta-lactamase class D